MSSLRLLLLIVVCGLWFKLSSLCGAESRPNVLLIYADDQSYKTIGCEPGAFPWAKTPNIDALAKSGVRFAGAYLGSWCMPSRASMLTGMYPHSIETMRMEGTYPGSTYDPQRCRFWPATFRTHGYHTAQIGKWHTGTDSGYGRDWDYQIVWNRPKYPENAGNYYANQILEINGVKQKATGYSTDNYTKWACEYLRGEQRDKSKPWFLWLCYGAIHGPSTPSERHRGMYADADVPTPTDIFAPRLGKPDYLNKTQAWFKDAQGQARMGKSGEKFGDDSGKSARTHAAFVRQMSECVPAIDEGVGQLIATLRETGQLDNTLIIYTADQGFAMGEHGFRTKLGPYDANYRSPFIVSCPGRVAVDKSCDHCVSAPDVVATIFAQSGIAPQWSLQGHDLSPLLKNPSDPNWNHVTYFEHFGHEYGSDIDHVIESGGTTAHDNVPWYIAIRTPTHKYIRSFASDISEEVYDLKRDPDELCNLADEQACKAVGLQRISNDELNKLRELAQAELKRTNVKFAKHLFK